MLDVKQGPVVYVNRIEVQGNTRTRDNVIRRDITLEEGSKFDAKALRTSTAKLNRLDFFESVNIAPRPTMREDLLDVVVDVKEKPTGQFAVSTWLFFLGPTAVHGRDFRAQPFWHRQQTCQGRGNGLWLG